MAGALFFICMFLIAVGSILLFRPVTMHSITDYSQPAAEEQRKQVTLKMAEYLEKNPQIVKQERFEKLPPGNTPSYDPSSSATPEQHSSAAHQVSVSFQGSQMQFETLAEFDQWIYSSVTQEPLGFVQQLKDDGNPELYLETLKKVTEIDRSDAVAEAVKTKYLEAARTLLQDKDGYHQQMMQKALQNYLDMEKDKGLGKKTADEILKDQ